MASAFLIERTWLKRVFEVTLDDSGQRPYKVVYHGRGIGYEAISVDGAIVSRHTSLLWFVPHFPFRIGGQDATIDVRVWPWFAIRSFRLSIDGETLYSESGSVDAVRD